MNKESEYVHPALVETESTVMRNRLSENGISNRQADVVELLSDGLTNQVIADILGISPKTVKVHLMFISYKLDTHNRAETAVTAIKFKYLADKDESATLSSIDSTQPDLKQQFGKKHSITDRETEIIALVAEGMKNKAIADKLHLGEKTVKSCLGHIYARFDADNRTSLAVMYAEYIFSRV